MAKKKTEDTPEETAEEVSGQTEEAATAEEAVETEETVKTEEPATAEETVESEEAATTVEADDSQQAEESSGDVDASELTLGEGSLTDDSQEPAVAPIVRGKIDKFGVAMGTGRRKTSVARVRIKEGDGALTINGRSLEDFCCIERDQMNVVAPLRVTDTLGKVDVWVRVGGGGTTGQTGAIVLGIARALQALDPSHHSKLAEGGYLTRDGRMVERKKYGLKKARKSFQFSKR